MKLPWDSLSQSHRELKALAVELTGDDDGLAEAAARQLGGLGRRAVPTLIRELGHWNSSVRELACRALGAIGAEAGKAVKPLLELIDKGLSDTTGKLTEAELAAAAAATGRIGDPRAIPILTKLLSERVDTSGLAAAEALGRFGSTAAAAAPILSQRLGPEIGRGIVHFKLIAAHSLGKLGEAGVEPLAKLARSSLAPDRKLAAEALGFAGDAASVALTSLARRDSQLEVRASAADALSRIGSKRALSGLARLVEESSDSAFKARATAALKRATAG